MSTLTAEDLLHPCWVGDPLSFRPRGFFAKIFGIPYVLNSIFMRGGR